MPVKGLDEHYRNLWLDEQEAGKTMRTERDALRASLNAKEREISDLQELLSKFPGETLKEKVAGLIQFTLAETKRADAYQEAMETIAKG